MKIYLLNELIKKKLLNFNFIFYFTLLTRFVQNVPFKLKC